MADANNTDLLNQLLARVYRSLLQYSGECWAWTSATETPGVETVEQKAVEQMAGRQRALVARLVALIADRGGNVDLGNYPDNSGMHYVSLEYLLGKLIADEQEVVAELDAASGRLKNDLAAASLVSELQSAERDNLARLRELATAPKTVPA